jgi:predicted kinase
MNLNSFFQRTVSSLKSVNNKLSALVAMVINSITESASVMEKKAIFEAKSRRRSRNNLINVHSLYYAEGQNSVFVLNVMGEFT